MKHIKIIIYCLCLSIFSSTFISCDESDGRFDPSPEQGWVQFRSSETLTNATDPTNVVELPVEINVPYNKEDLVVSYRLESVSGGDPNDFFSNDGNLLVPAGTAGTANVGGYPVIEFNIGEVGILTEPMIFDVVLVSTDRPSVVIGINDSTRPISHRVVIDCGVIPSLVPTNYSGSAASTDLGLPFGVAPGYIVDFTPVDGTNNSWFVESLWGPDFVNFLCGGCVPPGSFPYPATITLNQDGSVQVTGEEFYTIGGSGTYDPCSKTFTLNIGQDLFNGDFTVDVILTPN